MNIITWKFDVPKNLVEQLRKEYERNLADQIRREGITGVTVALDTSGCARLSGSDDALRKLALRHPHEFQPNAQAGQPTIGRPLVSTSMKVPTSPKVSTGFKIPNPNPIAKN